MKRGTFRAGFTLMEICVVLCIASIVAGMATVAGLHAKRAGDVRSAKASITALEAAVSGFTAERGRPPRDLDGDGVTTTAEVVEQLKEWELLPGDFSLQDPWGNELVVVLQRDYSSSTNTKRDINFYPVNDHPGGFQVYSAGPDGTAGSFPTQQAAADDLGNFEES